MTETAFICSDELWAGGFGEDHPLRPERLKMTYELLAAYHAFDSPHSHLLEPQTAVQEDLLFFHTSEYLDAVASLSRGEGNVKPGPLGFHPLETPVFPRMYEISAFKVGAALTGARWVTEKSDRIAFSIGGGMHHARPAQASGFCIFNDVAVAIHWFLQQGMRVAYVDIDVHHGDGVQDAFYDTDQVLTISLHQAGIMFYPGTGFPNEIGTGAGRGYSINVPFLPYTDDELYLWAFRQVVPPLVCQFKPDVLVTQLGVDTHYLDPLARLALTSHGYVALIKTFKTLATDIGRWLAFGGGGYAVDVVPRAWTLAYGLMSDQVFPEVFPPEYTQQYGCGRLHDVRGPHQIQGSLEQQIREYARFGVATLQDQTQEVWDWSGDRVAGDVE